MKKSETGNTAALLRYPPVRLRIGDGRDHAYGAGPHDEVRHTLREIGLSLHEIFAIADQMRDTYRNGDMNRLREHLAHLSVKTTVCASAVAEAADVNADTPAAADKASNKEEPCSRKA